MEKMKSYDILRDVGNVGKKLFEQIWTATVFSRTTTEKGGGGSMTELTKATGRV